MSRSPGIAASGHPETSRAAVEILRAGGNAFDAALAALCAACVAEPTMVSLGGGGYLLTRKPTGDPVVYDFFCQTPRRKRPVEELDFYPITADFGGEKQVFQVGMGAIAVPGVIAGLFEAHADLCRMPLRDIVQPAIALARRGVRFDQLHHFIVRILEPILTANPSVFHLFESPARPGELIGEGESQRNPALADALDLLARSGARLFYEGDWAEQLVRDSQHSGGYLELDDLKNYRVEKRVPLPFRYRGAECVINPPPSPGGCLIAFALALLENKIPQGTDWGGGVHVRAMVDALHTAGIAREEAESAARNMAGLLEPELLARWRSEVQHHSLFNRGTTHISVADAEGNFASLTASNGEGNVYLLPGTGIILNNMLGEEDLNPGGFHRWKAGSRLVSMMSPVIARETDGSLLALGTGGANRIRSAIMQVIVNILDFGMPLAEAVTAPRLHLEHDKLSLEPGFQPQALGVVRSTQPLDVHEWKAQNLFFGGVHAVRLHPSGRFEGAGDPRRGGVAEIA